MIAEGRRSSRATGRASAARPETGGPVDLLYIHPHGHLMSDWHVPIGALTSINSVAGSKLGVFSWEVTDDQIRSARVVAIDWYWHFTLPAVRAVARRVRRVNPTAPIIAGGLTASWFGKRAFDLLPLDYVVVGDAEVGMSRCIEMGTRGGAEVPPNFLRADGTSGPREIANQEQFDQLDPVSTEWFPSYDPRMSPPLILMVRGCNAPCGRVCLAGETAGSPLRIHSAEWLVSVARALRAVYGPEATLRLVNVGAHDESALIGTLDALAGEPHVGSLAIWTYGLDRDYLDYVLDCFPDAVIGLLSPWEVLGWPDRSVSATDAVEIIEPIEQLVARLRTSGRGRLSFHVPRRLKEESAEIIDRVMSDQTTVMPSDSFYIWTPESQRGRDLGTDEQAVHMESMGDLGARILIAEKVVPALVDLYAMRADPPPEPPDEPPFLELAPFHRLVSKGWQRWNMPAPEPFDFEVHVVRWDDDAGSTAVMKPSLPFLAEPHPKFRGAEVGFTECGVELTFLGDDLPEISPNRLALVVLPEGVSEYVGAHSVDVLFVPVHRWTPGEPLRLRLHVDPVHILAETK